MSPSERLTEMKLTLPPVPRPIGAYVPWVRSGRLILVSGQLPTREGTLLHAGKVGSDVSLDQAQEAARLCALNALAIAADGAGGIDNIRCILRVAVFVNSAAGFTDQPKVANGASDLFAQVFGEAGRHVRAAVGAAELPLNAPVELELTAEAWPAIRPGDFDI